MSTNRESVYWKEDPNLNLVKIDADSKAPAYEDENLNKRIKDTAYTATKTVKDLMNELFSKGLVTESTVKKANITGDPAHDKYPDRAVITVKPYIDKDTNNYRLYEDGVLKGQPILSVKADIGHGTSHIVLTLNTKGEFIKDINAREVMGRGEPPKFYSKEEIQSSPLIDKGLKEIAAYAETLIRDNQNSKSDFTVKIGKAVTANLSELAVRSDLNISPVEIGGVKGFVVDDLGPVVIYQDTNENWKYVDFSNNKIGDPIDFVQDVLKMNFKDAVAFINDTFDNKEKQNNREIN